MKHQQRLKSAIANYKEQQHQYVIAMRQSDTEQAAHHLKRMRYYRSVYDSLS